MSALAAPAGVAYGDVRRSVERAKASLEAAAEQIVWQVENRAWEVLGYADWNEMRAAEYGGAAFMVPRAERPELVARLRRSGLTNQEVADTAGIDERTARRDFAQSANADSPPVITNARGQARPASYARPTPQAAGGDETASDAATVVDSPPAETRTKAPEPVASPPAQSPAATVPQGEPVSRDVATGSPPRKVVGIDGKTYKPPALKPERSGEQQNAEENSRTLASALIFLLAFQHPAQRDHARTEWRRGSAAVSPTNRGYVTPDHMRHAAEGLARLADEWETTR